MARLIAFLLCSLLVLCNGNIDSRFEVQSYNDQQILVTITETLVTAAPGESFSGSFFDPTGNNQVYTDTYTGQELSYRYMAQFLFHISEFTVLVLANADVSTNPDIQLESTNSLPGQTPVPLSQRPSSPSPGRRRLLSDSCGLYYCDPNEDGYNDVFNKNALNLVRTQEVKNLITSYQAVQKVQQQWAATFVQKERVEQSRWAAQLNQSIQLQNLKVKIRDQLFQIVAAQNATNKGVQSLIASDQVSFNNTANLINRLSEQMTTTDATLIQLYAAMQATAKVVSAQNTDLSTTEIEMLAQLQLAASTQRDIIQYIADIATDQPTHDAVVQVYHTALKGVYSANPPRIPLLGDLGIPPGTLTDRQRFLVLDKFVEWFPAAGELLRWEYKTRCDFQMLASAGSRQQFSITDMQSLIGANVGCVPPPPNKLSATNFTLINCVNMCWVEESVSSAPLVDPYFDFFSFEGVFDELETWPSSIVDVAHVQHFPTTLYTDLTLLVNEQYMACNASTDDPTGQNRKRVWSMNTRSVMIVQPILRINGQFMDACSAASQAINKIAATAPTFPGIYWNGLTSGPQLLLSTIQQIRIFLAGTISNDVHYDTEYFRYSETPHSQLLSTRTTVSFLSTGPYMMPVWQANPTVANKGINLQSTSPTVQSGVNNDVDINDPTTFMLPNVIHFVGYPECLDTPCEVPGRPDLPPQTFIFDVPDISFSSDQNVNSRKGTVCGVTDFDRSSGPATINNKRPMMNYSTWISYNGGISIPRDLAMSPSIFRSEIVTNGPGDYSCVNTVSGGGVWCTLFDFYLVDISAIRQGIITFTPRPAQGATMQGLFHGSGGLLVEPNQQGCPSYFNVQDDEVNTVQISMKNTLITQPIDVTISVSPQAPSQVPPLIISTNQASIRSCFGISRFTLEPRKTITFSMPACGNQDLVVLVPPIQSSAPPRKCFHWESKIDPAKVQQIQQDIQTTSQSFVDDLLPQIIETGTIVNNLLAQMLTNALTLAKQAFLQPGTFQSRNISASTQAEINAMKNRSAQFRARVTAQAQAAAAQNQQVENNLKQQQQTLANVTIQVQDLGANIARSEAAIVRIAQNNAKLDSIIQRAAKFAALLKNITNQLNHTDYLLIQGTDPTVDYSKFNVNFWERMSRINCDDLNNLPPNPNCNHWYDFDKELCGSTYLTIYLVTIWPGLIFLLTLIAIIPGACCAAFRGAIYGCCCRKGCPPRACNCKGDRVPIAFKRVNRKDYDGRYDGA